MSLKDVITAIIRGTSAAATGVNSTTISTTTKPHLTEKDNTSIHLYRLFPLRWLITVHNQSVSESFTDVDVACDCLLKLGILDEQIDLALIDMSAKDTTHAVFGVDGLFISSDCTTSFA